MCSAAQVECPAISGNSYLVLVVVLVYHHGYGPGGAIQWSQLIGGNAVP